MRNKTGMILALGISVIALIVAIVAVAPVTVPSNEHDPNLRVTVYCDGKATAGVASPIFVTPGGDNPHITMRVRLNESNPDCVPNEGAHLTLAVR